MKRRTTNSQNSKLKSSKAPKKAKVYTRDDFEVRPATLDDKWCNFKKGTDPNAPYGYIVKIPNYSKKMRLSLGCIVKSKLFKNTLYLQVVDSIHRSEYMASELKRVHSGKKKKKEDKFLNISRSRV